jgi:hypothetical protein
MLQADAETVMPRRECVVAELESCILVGSSSDATGGDSGPPDGSEWFGSLVLSNYRVLFARSQEDDETVSGSKPTVFVTIGNIAKVEFHRRADSGGRASNAGGGGPTSPGRQGSNAGVAKAASELPDSPGRGGASDFSPAGLSRRVSTGGAPSGFLRIHLREGGCWVVGLVPLSTPPRLDIEEDRRAAMQAWKDEVAWLMAEDSFASTMLPSSLLKQFENKDAAPGSPEDLKDALASTPAPYDQLAEFRRLGVVAGSGAGGSSASSSDDYDALQDEVGSDFSSHWRVSEANKEYSLCGTYPAMLVVPSSVSDADLAKAGKHRAKHRVPSLVWTHPATGVAICRCAQPHDGILGTN